MQGEEDARGTAGALRLRVVLSDEYVRPLQEYAPLTAVLSARDRLLDREDLFRVRRPASELVLTRLEVFDILICRLRSHGFRIRRLLAELESVRKQADVGLLRS